MELPDRDSNMLAAKMQYIICIIYLWNNRNTIKKFLVSNWNEMSEIPMLYKNSLHKILTKLAAKLKEMEF
jgi:hypothetical protein